MSEWLYFNGGAAADTGEADSDSIRPIENGEDIVADTSNRPNENLRRRTDLLREEANYNRWIQDADRAVHFRMLSGNITWNGTVAGGGGGTGILSSTGTLRVIPMYGTGSSRTKTTTEGTSLEGSGAVYPAQLAYTELSNVGTATDGIDIVANVYAFDGANQITITINDTGATTIDVTVNGDGTVSDPGALPGQDDIVVSMDSGTHDITAVAAAINGDPVASLLVTATVVGSVTTSPAYAVSKVFLVDALDGVYHEITGPTLASFFGTPSNLLAEGDTLGIYYANTRNRRRSVEETGEKNIPVSSLVNMTAEPAKAPGAVIIGKVVDNAFILANGVPLDKDAAVTLVSQQDTLIRDDYERGITTPPAIGTQEGTKRLGADASTFTYLSISSESQQEVNENVDTLLSQLRDDIERGITTPPTKGTEEGSKRLGVDASTFEQLSTSLETQQAVNEAIDQALKTPILTVGPNLGFHATLEAALTAAGLLTYPTRIEILEALSIDGSTVNELAVPDGCVISGRGPQDITVSDLGATCLFDLDSTAEVRFENLSFLGGGAMNAESTVFGDVAGTVTSLIVQNCALVEGGTAATTWGHFIDFDNMVSDRLIVRDCVKLQAKGAVILLETAGAATDVEVLIENCQFGDTSTWANGNPLDIDQSVTDNTRVTVRDCYFGTIDSGSLLGECSVGARHVTLSNLSFKNCSLKTGSAAGDDCTVHANGLRFDFTSMPSDYPQDADGDSYAMTLVTSDWSQVTNVSIDMTDATYAGLTVYGILLNTSDHVTITNAQITHAPGVGIGIKNSSAFTRVVGCTLDGVSSSYGVEIGEDDMTTVSRVVITGCVFKDYAVQQAIQVFGDDVVLGDLLIDQGAGGNGYTLDAGHSGNAIANLLVF